MAKHRGPDADDVRAVLATVGQRAKAELAAGAETVDPIRYLEQDFGRSMKDWPAEALVAFVAVGLATCPSGVPLHKTPRDHILPALRVAYRSVRERAT